MYPLEAVLHHQHSLPVAARGKSVFRHLYNPFLFQDFISMFYVVFVCAYRLPKPRTGCKPIHWNGLYVDANGTLRLAVVKKTSHDLLQPVYLCLSFYCILSLSPSLHLTRLYPAKVWFSPWFVAIKTRGENHKFQPGHNFSPPHDLQIHGGEGYIFLHHLLHSFHSCLFSAFSVSLSPIVSCFWWCTTPFS